MHINVVHDLVTFCIHVLSDLILDSQRQEPENKASTVVILKWIAAG